MRARQVVWSGLLAFAAFLPAGAQSADAPAAAERLSPTTTSAEARMHVIAALDERLHPYPAAARRHFEQALAADPTMPLARAGAALLQPGLTTAQRIEAVEQAIAEGVDASAAELTLMLSWREVLAGRPGSGLELIRAARALAPGEPAIAHEYALRVPAGAPRIEALREALARFPSYGPSHNIIAYQLYEAGEREAGIRHVREYLRHSPDHPNAHDSYAEIMVWEGQHDEAERAYRRTGELSADFADFARDGLAEVNLARGRHDAARALWRSALDTTTGADARRQLEFNIAVSHLFEGDVTAALRAMERIADEASAADAPGVARLGYWFAAMFAAQQGDARAASRFMDQAARQEGQADASLPLRRALAAPHDADLVRSIAAELQAAVDAPNAALRLADDLRLVRTIEAVNARDFARAEATARGIVGASFRKLGLAFVAEGLQQAGRSADARRLRADVMTRPDFTIIGALARAKVTGL